MSKGDVVIANSEFTRSHVLREYNLDPKRVVTIPRGVDLDQFDPDKIDPAAITKLRATWGLAADDPRLVVIMPARVTRWKGPLLLIDAIARLQKRRPGSVRVILAGDAQGRQDFVGEVEQAIAAGGLHEIVSLVGHVGQIAVALAASDIAVFPSIEPEAFGRGAVEASAMHKPVIAAAHGGLTETIIDGETGILVKPSDAEALASAIEKLIDLGPAGRAEMGKKGQNRVRQHYSKTALQNATLRVYDQLLGEAR